MCASCYNWPRKSEAPAACYGGEIDRLRAENMDLKGELFAQVTVLRNENAKLREALLWAMNEEAICTRGFECDDPEHKKAWDLVRPS